MVRVCLYRCVGGGGFCVGTAASWMIPFFPLLPVWLVNELTVRRDSHTPIPPPPLVPPRCRANIGEVFAERFADPHSALRFHGGAVLFAQAEYVLCPVSRSACFSLLPFLPLHEPFLLWVLPPYVTEDVEFAQ